MKILVLGAGVIGTATAWYAARAGHEVVVVDRHEGAGLETSFANGGQISVSHAEPWANPDAPLKLAKWLARDDAPLLFRLRADPAQWAWGARFLYECTAWRTRENIAQIVKLSVYSRRELQALREETAIEYCALAKGILHYYTERDEFDRALEASEVMRRHGLALEMKTVDEAIAIEPALAQARERLVGATYSASDESGDAHLFTKNLAALAAERGVTFLYNRTILGVRVEDGRIAGVVVKSQEGEETLRADAYVVALAAYSPLLTRPIGIDLPVYPAKGYSASIPVADPALAFTVSLTDDHAKLVFSRLGDRMRVAGTAELSGYSLELNDVRCQAIVRRAREFFPGAGHYDRATFWAGLRPSTPSNVPIIGRTRYPNLYLNTGHGTLGWTMACGSGSALADIISGRKPQVDFAFSE
jgi:D-amino-acid dehydrogenase